MQKIVSMLLIFLTLVLAVQPLGAWQSDPLCGQLDDVDCEIFLNALQAMREAETFNNAAFTVTVGGSGGTSTGNELSITGAGPMQLGEDGQVTAMHLTGTSDDMPLEFLLLDDMFYVANELVWTGASIDDDPNAVLLANVLTGNVFLSAFETPGLFTPTRIDDESMGDQTMIVFEGQVDVVNFLLTPSMLNVLDEGLQSAPEDALGGGDADLEGAIGLLPLLLEQDIFEVVIWVGEDDGLIHHVELLIDVILDATMIDPELGAVGFRLDVASDLDGHGEAYVFEAPEDFAPLATSPFDFIPADALTVGAGPVENIPDSERYAVEETIAYGETVSGSLSEGNPQDVWGFEAEAGDVVTVVLKAADVESSLDSLLYLRDSDGAELAFNDDHGSDRDDLTIFDSLLADFEIPADGEYRIVATWLTETRDGDYELSLEVAE